MNTNKDYIYYEFDDEEKSQYKEHLTDTQIQDLCICISNICYMITTCFGHRVF
jgi:hypothetical protein